MTASERLVTARAATAKHIHNRLKNAVSSQLSGSDLKARESVTVGRTALLAGGRKTPSRTRKSAQPGGSGSTSLRNVTPEKVGYHSVKEQADTCAASMGRDVRLNGGWRAAACWVEIRCIVHPQLTHLDKLSDGACINVTVSLCCSNPALAPGRPHARGTVPAW